MCVSRSYLHEPPQTPLRNCINNERSFKNDHQPSHNVIHRCTIVLWPREALSMSIIQGLTNLTTTAWIIQINTVYWAACKKKTDGPLTVTKKTTWESSNFFSITVSHSLHEMNTLFVSNHSISNLDEGYFSDGLLGGAFKTEKSCPLRPFSNHWFWRRQMRPNIYCCHHLL